MSDARRPELDFLHSWAVVLPTFKSEESLGYKFGSVKAFIKRLTCVNQKCLLRSLVMQLVVKLRETDLDFRIPLAEIFSESTNTRTKHTKVFFTVYCILTIYVKSRLLDYVY